MHHTLSRISTFYVANLTATCAYYMQTTFRKSKQKLKLQVRPSTTIDMYVYRTRAFQRDPVHGHFGPKTLRTQDISTPCVWCQSVSNFFAGAGVQVSKRHFGTSAEVSQTLRHQLSA